MSATNRGTVRREADYYPTDPRETAKVYHWLRRHDYVDRETPIVDPCAGQGAILKALREQGHRGFLRGLELRTECAAELIKVQGTGLGLDCYLVVGCDALDLARNATTDRLWRDETVITNPPFGLAREFVDAWAKPAMLAAMLLPLSLLGSEERAEWWPTVRPAHVLVLSQRPSFVAVCEGRAGAKGCGKTYPKGKRGECDCGGKIADGTDAMTYAWFVWTAHPQPGVPALDWI